MYQILFLLCRFINQTKIKNMVQTSIPVTAPGEYQAQLESLIGKKATIFQHSSMGFPQSICCVINRVYRNDYAQYKNLLHIIYTPERKRTQYVIRLYDYSSILVYAGHIRLNAEMFVSNERCGGMTMGRSLLSFSDEYFDRAIASTNESPVLHIRHNIH